MKNTLLILLLLFGANLSIKAQQITGTTGKIWYHNKVIYANIVNEGVLVIDNKDPKAPKKLGFIEIPGNVDIAVLDNVLIANNHNDLITIDITELEKVKVLRRFRGVFPQHGTGKRDIAWVKPPKKTWIASKTNIAGNGLGGSMACLTIVGQHMYAINGSEIHSFDVSKPKKISKHKSVVRINHDALETIFSTEKNLFIGAQKGMYIYSVENPKKPKFRSRFEHAKSCDPVVVEGNRAYITLRDDTDCQRAENRLAIVDISNPSNPVRISSFWGVTNPHGLAVDCGYVYLCDGVGGFKVIDATNPASIKIKQQFDEVKETYDVIALQREKVLMMVGDGQLIQYDYTNKTDLKKLSVVSIDL